MQATVTGCYRKAFKPMTKPNPKPKPEPGPEPVLHQTLNAFFSKLC